MAGSLDEPGFVGADRRDLVEQLVAAFDGCAVRGEAAWVAIEAPQGFGKTRVVREFYGRLANRQEEPRFWPPSILGAASGVGGAAGGRGGLVEPQVRRKRVYPEQFRAEAGALPSWFWWGIACDRRNGTPMESLAHDLRQFEVHRSALEQTWRANATLRARARHAAKGKGSAAEAGMGDAAGVAIGAAVGVTVPVLGLALWGAKTARDYGHGRVQDRQSRQEGFSVPDPEEVRVNLVDEVALQLPRLASGGLPVVLFVEDAHVAEASLASLLVRLVVSSAPILVITTSWPGTLDEETRPIAGAYAEVTTRTPQRANRVPLEPLDPSALLELLAAYAPNTDPATAAAVVEQYDNPLLLETFLTLRATRRRIDDGALVMSPARIASLPEDLRTLLEQRWQELPEGVRDALSLSAMSAPHNITAVEPACADDRWLFAAVESVLPSEELREGLRRGRDVFRIVRLATETLARFSEASLETVALTHGRDEFDDAERADYLTALLAVLLAERPGDADAKEYRARLHLSLVTEGLAEPGITYLDDVYLLAKAAYDAFEYSTSARLITNAAPFFGDDHNSLELRALAGSALGAAGQVEDAIEQFDDLVDDQIRVLGPDHPDTLATRGNLALWVGKAGRVGEAIDRLVVLVDDQIRVLGPDHQDTLGTRHNLACLLGEAGRVGEAIDILGVLVDDQIRVLGPDHRDTLTARKNLAFLLGQAGRVGEAIDGLVVLVDDQIRVLGPDHPDTLIARVSLVFWLGKAGRVAEAIDRFGVLLTEFTRVLGPDHPDTLTTRSNLASVLGKAGRVGAAIDQLTVLLADRIRVLGPDHPDTLTTRNNLAFLLGKAGRVGEAIDQLTVLVDDRIRVLGPDHPDTLSARGNLALWLGKAGRVDEAFDQVTVLLDDRTRVLGPDHPDTLSSRSNLAFLLGVAGRVGEAIDQFGVLRTEFTRVLGPDHPDTLTALNNLAAWLAEAGRLGEAIDILGVLVDARIRVLGPDHPDTLTTRNNLAAWLAEAGRLGEAIDIFTLLLDDGIRVLGPDHPDTLTTRNNLAAWLGAAGRVDEAIDMFTLLLDDQTRVLGPDHPDTLATQEYLDYFRRIDPSE